MTEVSLPYSVTNVAESAFSYCTSLVEILLPENITVIGENAFSHCTSLSSLLLPDSITEVEGNAFEGCTKLSNVKLSNQLETLGYHAFGNCASLTQIEIPKSLKYTPCSSGYDYGPFNGSGLKTVTFEYGTSEIPSSLFYHATNLQNIVFVDTITSINGGATYAGAFYGCTSLKTVSLPDSITSIGERAFYGCSNLESIKIPSKLQDISSGAFYNCKSLKDIVLPETVTEIGQSAFCGCAALSSINLPDGLQTIEDNAFYECKALTDITIPKSVTSIGSSAFYNCDSLQTAIINASGTVGSQAFYDCDALTTLTLADGITKIGSSLCYGCDKLTDIKFGKYITEIPDSSFRKCAALQSVTLPRFCKTVAANAFAEDTKLTAAYVPVSVSSIQSNSFSYPKKMTMYGKDGSYAQEYASNRKMTFSAVNAPISGFSFADNTLMVDRYKTFTEPLNISPDFDTDTITFTSSNTNVATVSENGEIYTRSYGSAKISAKASDGNKTATLNLTVAAPVHAETIKLDKNNISLRLGTTAKLNATVTPSNTSDTVRWATSDRNIVAVENGNLTPVAMGTATITAITSNGLTDRCTVTVLTDSVISKLSAKRNGTTLTASLESVKVENEAKAVFAAYTSKNVLCGMTEVFVSDNAATAEFKAENAAYVKAFIWKANGMIPIVTPERVTVQ